MIFNGDRQDAWQDAFSLASILSQEGRAVTLQFNNILSNGIKEAWPVLWVSHSYSPTAAYVEVNALPTRSKLWRIQQPGGTGRWLEIDSSQHIRHLAYEVSHFLNVVTA